MLKNVGYGSCTITTDNRLGCIDISTMEDGCWYVNRLYVQPSYRNQGFATSMMRELISVADSQAKDILIEINPYGDLNYDQLKSFYMKFGFDQIGENLFKRIHKEVE